MLAHVYCASALLLCHLPEQQSPFLRVSDAQFGVTGRRLRVDQPYLDLDRAVLGGEFERI